MAQYDEEFKRAVVEEYLKGASGYKVLSVKFGVTRIAIKVWVNLYRHHGDVGLRKGLSHYSARFKLPCCHRNRQPLAAVPLIIRRCGIRWISISNPPC